MRIEKEWIPPCLILAILLGFIAYAANESPGDVRTAAAVSQLSGHARGLLCAIMCDSNQLVENTWPRSEKETSTEYFLKLLKNGVIPDQCIAGMVTPRTGHQRRFPGCSQSGAVRKLTQDAIRPENVQWVVVLGCDGKLFSDTNRPAKNLPFLVTRNIAGDRWIPAEGITLAKGKDELRGHVVMVNFEGMTFHFAAHRTSKEIVIAELGKITNCLMLGRP